MIGTLCVLKRLPSLSLEDFQRYWRETHGPLVARYATNLGICRYVQDHMLQDPLNQEMQESRGTMDPYDGIDELWWRYFEEPGKALATPEGQQAYLDIVEDERKFIDFSRSSLVFVIELPQINPPEDKLFATANTTLIKTTGILKRLPKLSFEECQLYWRTDHGTLLRSFSAIRRARRYLQLHTIKHPPINSLTEKLRNMRGKMEEPFEGLATVVADRVELDAARATPDFQRTSEEIFKDELKFIDLSRCAIWANKEYVFIDK